jgi:hypothetical protein
MTNQTEKALPHLVHCMDKLESIKRDGLDSGMAEATAWDALTDLKDAMFKLGVPPELIHDHPDQLPR